MIEEQLIKTILDQGITGAFLIYLILDRNRMINKLVNAFENQSEKLQELITEIKISKR